MTHRILQAWLARFSQKEQVRSFLQEQLGCQCPEEVFDHYLVKIVESDRHTLLKILVGERLLIYVIEYNAISLPPEAVAQLLVDGQKRTDALRFSRFRLVVLDVPGNKHTELYNAAHQLGDPKVHLHIIRSTFGS